MIKFAIFISFFICNLIYADVPVKIVDKKVVFAYGSVNGKNYWDKISYDKAILNYNPINTGTGTVVLDQNVYVKTKEEINLSTCTGNSFVNYSEWDSIKTKEGIVKEIKKLRIELDSMSDLPASDRRDLQERLLWLKSYYQSLP